MRPSHRLGSLVVLALLAGGCSVEPRTEVIVIVEADPLVRQRAQSVRIQVYGGGAEGYPSDLRHENNEPSPLPWPLTHGVIPRDSEASRLFRFEAVALDASGREIAYLRAISGFVARQTLALRLRFYDACLDQDPCEPNESCNIDGQCVDATNPPLEPFDPGLLDAGAARDGGTVVPLDAGALCPDGCDDRNPCTDDRCTAAGCENTANNVSCSDDVYCNGLEECSASECASGVPPCAGVTKCDEEADACVGCISTADCPSATEEVGVCVFPPDTCVSGGTQPVTTTSYACVEGVCMPSAMTTPRACTRATAGTVCRTTTRCDTTSCPGRVVDDTFVCGGGRCGTVPASSTATGTACTGTCLDAGRSDAGSSDAGHLDAGTGLADGGGEDCFNGVDDDGDSDVDCFDMEDCFGECSGMCGPSMCRFVGCHIYPDCMAMMSDAAVDPVPPSPPPPVPE
jgi:hypothetical protein